MTLKRYLCIVRALFLLALVFKMKSKEQVEGKNLEIVLAMRGLAPFVSIQGKSLGTHVRDSILVRETKNDRGRSSGNSGATYFAILVTALWRRT